MVEAHKSKKNDKINTIRASQPRHSNSEMLPVKLQFVWFGEGKRRSRGWKSHVWSTTEPQPPSLLGLCCSVYYVGWSSWSDQLLLLWMDSHGLSLKSGGLLIQTVKGPFCFCMRRRGTWQNVAVWRPGNETESVNSTESGKCQKTGRLKTLSSWKVTPVSDVSRLLNNIT